MKKCIDCNAEIYINTYLYGTKRCQSCAAKNNIKIYGHPMQGKHHTEKSKELNRKAHYKIGTKHCVDCNKDLEHHKKEVKRCNSCAKKYQYATRPDTHPWLHQTGKNAPNYINGKGHEPYPVEFNKYLKNFIRNRDNYQCQLCEKKGNYVHHIDYNKKNCRKKNLITLCNKCNLKVNSNRDYWFAYFTYIMETIYDYKRF